MKLSTKSRYAVTAMMDLAIDRYSSIYNNKGKRTKTIPHKGYENSLMGKVGFDIKPSNQTMTNILNNTKNSHVYEK